MSGKSSNRGSVRAPLTILVAGLAAWLVVLVFGHRRDASQLESLRLQAESLGFEGPDLPGSASTSSAESAGAPMPGAGLRASAAPRGADPRAAAIAETKARVASLRATMDGLVAAKDGKGMLKLMQSLAALGPAGYRAAMDVAMAMSKRLDEDDSWSLDDLAEWGLEAEDFDDAMCGPCVPMCVWALENPTESPPVFRGRILTVLIDRKEVQAADIFLRVFRIEPDEQIRRYLASNVELVYEFRQSDNTPSTPAELAALASGVKASTRDPLCTANLAYALAIAGAWEELEELAKDSDATVRTTALAALLSRTPPATGELVLFVWAMSSKDFQQGDILLESTPAPDGLSTQVRFLRNGQEITKTVADSPYVNTRRVKKAP